MIEAAEREGNFETGRYRGRSDVWKHGIGLAIAAAVKGYKCIFVMTDKASVEKSRYLKALGADVVITPVSAKPGTPDHYVSTAKRIASETPNSFYPDPCEPFKSRRALPHNRSRGVEANRRQNHTLRRRPRNRRHDLRNGSILKREEPQDQDHWRRSLRFNFHDVQGDWKDRRSDALPG